MDKNKIGIIGFGSQGKRIVSILNKLKKKNYTIYKKTPFNPAIKKTTNDFNLIKKCGIIFVCSPNRTHFNIIKKLSKGRYIFCEKPPVDTLKELNNIEKIDLSKIYFNFNFRFSKINSSLKSTKKYKFGRLLYGNMIMGHGLATKKAFKGSWRSNKTNGVYDILAIHLIDIIANNFSISKVNKKLSNFISKTGSDNSYFSIVLKKFGQIDCFVSYTSPFKQKFEFIFENGMLIIDNNQIIFRGPRNTFNKKGLFISPKILKHERMNQSKDYVESLRKSIKYFFKTLKNNQRFSKNENKLSLLSNKLMLNNQK
tara:strand:+ start:34198 stop:35133 length:936 start_codon:yes stop_codon:yes gene_type:complete